VACLRQVVLAAPRSIRLLGQLRERTDAASDRRLHISLLSGSSGGASGPIVTGDASLPLLGLKLVAHQAATAADASEETGASVVFATEAWFRGVGGRRRRRPTFWFELFLRLRLQRPSGRAGGAAFVDFGPRIVPVDSASFT